MRQVSAEMKPINITGYLTPLHTDGTAALLRLERTPFLVLFTTKEKYDEEIGRVFPGTLIRCVKIDDMGLFLDSLGGHVRVMVDPTVNDEGKTQFLEVHPWGIVN